MNYYDRSSKQKLLSFELYIDYTSNFNLKQIKWDNQNIHYYEIKKNRTLTTYRTNSQQNNDTSTHITQIINTSTHITQTIDTS